MNLTADNLACSLSHAKAVAHCSRFSMSIDSRNFTIRQSCFVGSSIQSSGTAGGRDAFNRRRTAYEKGPKYGNYTSLFCFFGLVLNLRSVQASRASLLAGEQRKSHRREVQPAAA